MATVIYSLYYNNLFSSRASLPDDCRVVYWRPTWNSILPPGKGCKYVVYWLYHFAGMFKNKDYRALLLYDKGRLVTSLLIVPAHFMWPFMGKDDLQFTYVMTHPDYRGKGLAEMAICHAIRDVSRPYRNFWYVTDTENRSSIKLCTKIGFTFSAYGKRVGSLGILKPFQENNEN